VLPRRIAARGAEASQRSQRARSGIELLPELGPIQPEHRWALLPSSDRRAFQPLHELTVDLDDKLAGGMATSLEDRAGLRSSLEQHRPEPGWTRRLAVAVMKEIAPRSTGALVGNVLSEKMLKPPAVVIQAPLEVTPNRPLRMGALMLALHVVVVPDERFELLSAWWREYPHEPQLRMRLGVPSSVAIRDRGFGFPRTLAGVRIAILESVRLLFLGTGASGGTPGHGRSRRLESSVLISNRATLLIDVTRDFAVQAERLTRIDAVALTHAHRDAIGGLPALRRWWLANHAPEPIDVFLSEATANIIRTRYQRLEHCRLRITAPGDIRRVGLLALSVLTVPHAQDPRFPTYAWRVSASGRSIVYASDVAHLTAELERFSAGATVLVLDGAMWHRRLFSHLTIDEALPTACTWPVGSILLIQIGRSAPPHAQLQREVGALCAKAHAAHDRLAVKI